MGKTDLNSKKSFHPKNWRNQERVAKQQKAAIEERKKIKEIVSQRTEERAREELERKLAESTGKPILERVEWMYAGPTDGQTGTAEENEAYLLGKRRIDNLIKSADEVKLDTAAGPERPQVPLTIANKARDAAAKLREDPLLAIKKQQQAAYEAAMSNATKKRELLASVGPDDSEQRRRDEKDRRRSHRRHRDHSAESRDSRHRRRHGSRSPSAGPAGGYSRSARRRDDGIPYRSRPDDYQENRRYRSSRLAQQRGNNDSDDTNRAQAPLDRKSRRDPPDLGRPDLDRPDPDHPDPDRPDPDRSDHGSGRPVQQRNDGAAERERKLAAMQAAASELDLDRSRRLQEVDKREWQAQEADNRAREKADRHGGGDPEFVNGLRRKADLDVADRMGQGRQSLQRYRDED